MPIHYQVTWGKQGSKNFKNLSTAEKFAKSKAKKTGKTMDIDKVIHRKYIKPKK